MTCYQCNDNSTFLFLYILATNLLAKIVTDFRGIFKKILFEYLRSLIGWYV